MLSTGSASGVVRTDTGAVSTNSAPSSAATAAAATSNPVERT